jgi:hypothetical protein
MINLFLDINDNPKGNIGARQAGINKAKRRKSPSSSTPGNNRGKSAKLRVACYTCPMVAGDNIYVSAKKTAKRVICKSGHIVDCTGGCKLMEE